MTIRAALTESSSGQKVNMDYFANSKLFGDAVNDGDDVETGGSSGAAGSESSYSQGVRMTLYIEVCGCAP